MINVCFNKQLTCLSVSGVDDSVIETLCGSIHDSEVINMNTYVVTLEFLSDYSFASNGFWIAYKIGMIFLYMF